MKVRPSVKKMCEKCKIIKRKGKVIGKACPAVRPASFLQSDQKNHSTQNLLSWYQPPSL